MTNNPKQIASQVSKLINPALRKEISRYNLKVIKEKFTWDQVMLKYFKLYRSLI